MGRRLLWILLIGLGLSLLILIARHDAGTIGSLTNDDFASLAVKIAFLVFLGGTVLVLFRENFSQALQAVLFWVVVGLVLAVG